MSPIRRAAFSPASGPVCSQRSPIAWLAGVPLLATLACAQPFGRLDGIVVEARPAMPGEFGRVQVTREGKSRDGAPGMSIAKADQLATAPDGAAILTLQAGYEIIMEPGTELTIENPSIFVTIGKLIVKLREGFEQAKEALTVNTEFVSAGVEGTQFFFEVTREKAVQVGVLEGHVTVRSKQARWPPVTYRAGDAATIRGDAAPSRTQQLDPATIRAIRQRILEVEQAVRPSVPDVRGMSENDARALLTRTGLRPGSTSKVITRRVPAGLVVGTIPPAGTARRAGDRVTLQVEDSSLVVPTVLGLSFGEAARQIMIAGFPSPDSVSVFQTNAHIGTVVGMAPSAGTAVSAFTRIRLSVAGAAPVSPSVDTTTTTRTCSVPSLANNTEAAARRSLRAARLQAGVVNHYTGNTVSAQRPQAGTQVQCGSRVDFDVGVVQIQ